MDKEFFDQFQILIHMMENMAAKKDLESMATKEDVDTARRHTEILIENTITKRIDALFDGYKLTHEKQYELERETQRLKEKVDTLETRLALLESKIA